MVLATMFGFLLALPGAPSAQGAEMTRMQVAWSEPVDVVVEVWLKDFFGPKADSVSGANGIPQSRLDDPGRLGRPPPNSSIWHPSRTGGSHTASATSRIRRPMPRCTSLSRTLTAQSSHATIQSPRAASGASRSPRRNLRHAAGPRRHGESGVHEAGTRSDDVRRRVPH